MKWCIANITKVISHLFNSQDEQDHLLFRESDEKMIRSVRLETKRRAQRHKSALLSKKVFGRRSYFIPVIACRSWLLQKDTQDNVLLGTFVKTAYNVIPFKSVNDIYDKKVTQLP
jgi:hypothetical protein